jgi:phage/plasmid-like protein (TIGR03299 family)
MAHELEHEKSMAYVGETPWHQLGVRLETAPSTGADMMRAASCDWTVSMQPVNITASGRDVPFSRAIMRDSDGVPLGMASPDWNPVQNLDAFEFFDPIVSEGKGTYETAGSLRGGQVVWVLAKLSESFVVVGDDVVSSYLLLTNTFDGKSAVRARYTPIRVVCMNTLRAALTGFERRAVDASAANVEKHRAQRKPKREDAVSIRHVGDVKAKLAQAQELMGFAHKRAEETAEAYQAMARKQLQAAEIMDFLVELIPDNPEAKSHKRTENMRAEIMSLIDAGIGSNMPGVRGTLWGALNAVSEFYQHSRGVSVAEVIGPDGRVKSDEQSAKTYRKAQSHLESLWFGTTDQLIAQATDLAIKRLT